MNVSEIQSFITTCSDADLAAILWSCAKRQIDCGPVPVQARYMPMEEVARTSFHIGQRVKASNSSRSVIGKVIKVNRQTIVIRCEDTQRQVKASISLVRAA
jgi:hypothetical protein